MFDNNFNEEKGIAGFACLFNAEICLARIEIRVPAFL